MAAGNEWLHGYLEAILDVGSSTNKKQDGKHRIARFDDKQKQEKLFNPTKYFVEEVVHSFDESDLYKTWTKVFFNTHYSLLPLSLSQS